jgi:hypothetical protein
MTKMMKDHSIFLSNVTACIQLILVCEISGNIQLGVIGIRTDRAHMAPSFGKNKRVHPDKTNMVT